MGNRAESFGQPSTLCSRCGGSTIPIAYGMPDADLFDAAERGEVELAGCIMPDNAADEAVPDVRRWAGRSRPRLILPVDGACAGGSVCAPSSGGGPADPGGDEDVFVDSGESEHGPAVVEGKAHGEGDRAALPQLTQRQPLAG